MSYKLKQTNTGGFLITDQLDPDNITGASPLSTVVASHVALGPFIVTTLKLNNVAQTVVNGTEYQGTKIFDFPQCRMNVLGVTATLQQKTTSALASTLNASSTGAISLGTATASATTLASTMVDFLPSTAFVSSATVNVAGTAVTAALAASAQFDGTATAKDLYLNTAYATTGDVDADATQTISGTVVITWVNLGDL
jgi:hypothetical protein